MVRRVWPFVHAALTLAAVGACGYLLVRPAEPARHRPLPDGDEDLRTFLNVGWIGGTYRLPPGDDHCAVKLLLFTDGALAESFGGTVFSPEPGGDRTVPYTFLWSTGPDGPPPLARHAFGWSRGSPRAELCARLNGPVVRAIGAAPCDDRDGYRVVGYASSGEVRPGSERSKDVSSAGLAGEIERCRHVLAVGVKVFPTKEDARAFWDRSHGEPRP